LTMEATETKLKIGHQFLFWKKFPKRLTTMSASLGDCDFPCRQPRAWTGATWTSARMPTNGALDGQVSVKWW
jgi:hypothetical protein